MSEALRLAEQLERFGADLLVEAKTAQELRRLDSVNRELLDTLKFIAEIDLTGTDDRCSGLICHTLIHKARAAIAKGDSHDQT